MNQVLTIRIERMAPREDLFHVDPELTAQFGRLIFEPRRGCTRPRYNRPDPKLSDHRQFDYIARYSAAA
jgi:hypothetical protein